MVDRRLVAYARKMQRAGYEDDRLRSLMASSGYADEDIDMAIEAGRPSEDHERSRFVLLILSIICFSVAAVLIVLLVLFLISDRSSTTPKTTAKQPVTEMPSTPQSTPEPADENPTGSSVDCTDRACLLERLISCTPATAELSKTLIVEEKEVVIHYQEEIYQEDVCLIDVTLLDLDGPLKYRMAASTVKGESMTCATDQRSDPLDDLTSLDCEGALAETIALLTR